MEKEVKKNDWHRGIGDKEGRMAKNCNKTGTYKKEERRENKWKKKIKNMAAEPKKKTKKKTGKKRKSVKTEKRK